MLKTSRQHTHTSARRPSPPTFLSNYEGLMCCKFGQPGAEKHEHKRKRLQEAEEPIARHASYFVVLALGSRDTEPPITMAKHGIHNALGRAVNFARRLNSRRRCSNRSCADLNAVAEAVFEAHLISRRTCAGLLAPRCWTNLAIIESNLDANRVLLLGRVPCCPSNPVC